MESINLGCGYNKINGYINIDNNGACKPDVTVDIVWMGLPYGDNSVGRVRAFDFLEHVPQSRMIYVIEEIYRVLKPGGTFEHFTPSTDGRGAFQDPTHKSFWNINSWYYYCPGMVYGKTFYDIKAKFKIDVLEDVWTDQRNNVIHTYGRMFKVSG